MKVLVSEEIESVCPGFVGAAVSAEVVNTKYNEDLWKEIEEWGTKYRAGYTTETIKHISGIEATRRVYRACGKDPSRYRPASEALIRRMLQGKALYQIDTLVDLVNLASIAYGYSIGGFDADKFVGDTLTLGVGREGEPYEGIGRGMLNIAGLPCIVMPQEVWALLQATTSAQRWRCLLKMCWCLSTDTTVMKIM